MDEVHDKELSQRTKKHIFRILSSALNNGKRYGIKEGIMEGIESPKVGRQQIEYWTQEEVQDFIGRQFKEQEPCYADYPCACNRDATW